MSKFYHKNVAPEIKTLSILLQIKSNNSVQINIILIRNLGKKVSDCSALLYNNPRLWKAASNFSPSLCKITGN